MGSDLLSDVPQILADVFEQGAISWRPVVGKGDWTALAGARLSNRRESVRYDEIHQREHAATEADLTTPAASDSLLADYEIQEADGTTWAVSERRPDADTGILRYTVHRDPTKRLGADKGHTR